MIWSKCTSVVMLLLLSSWNGMSVVCKPASWMLWPLSLGCRFVFGLYVVCGDGWYLDPMVPQQYSGIAHTRCYFYLVHYKEATGVLGVVVRTPGGGLNTPKLFFCVFAFCWS